MNRANSTPVATNQQADHGQGLQTHYAFSSRSGNGKSMIMDAMIEQVASHLVPASDDFRRSMRTEVTSIKSASSSTHLSL